jgi:hypothetical protein
MAIDSQNKRRSALLRISTPLPVPDLMIGILDRPHVWSIYRGISTVVIAVTNTCRVFTPTETRIFVVDAETRVYTPECD